MIRDVRDWMVNREGAVERYEGLEVRDWMVNREGAVERYEGLEVRDYMSGYKKGDGEM